MSILFISSEQIPLVSLGLIVWLFVPAAFVELQTKDVTSLSPWEQLKIYCAGVLALFIYNKFCYHYLLNIKGIHTFNMKLRFLQVWHNIVISVLAFVIMTFLPILLIPLFQTGVGISVLNLDTVRCTAIY